MSHSTSLLRDAELLQSFEHFYQHTLTEWRPVCLYDSVPSVLCNMEHTNCSGWFCISLWLSMHVQHDVS